MWKKVIMVIPYKSFKDKINIVKKWESQGYYVEIWDGFVYVEGLEPA